jgi:hypothetical protein
LIDAYVDVVAAAGDAGTIRLRTGRDGRVSVGLPAGQYRVVPRRPARFRLRRPAARALRLAPGENADVIFDYPSGLQ